MEFRISVVLITALLASGQMQRPQFEVASVKPHPGFDRPVSIGAPSPGTFKAENVWLRFLVQWAWNVKDFQVTGGPGWAASDRFDVTAKAAGKVNINGMRPMLQALLEDRFRLTLHREDREMPIFALTAAKAGLRLHAVDEKSCATGEPPKSCGAMATSPHSLNGTAVSMEQFTTALTNIMQRTVVDKTGFTGKFDVSLEWSADQSTPGFFAPGLAPHESVTSDSPLPSGPTIFTVLDEQLGLKLESTKGPVPVLVIDHAEKPAAN